MIRYALFDLDNTLYPSAVGLEDDTVKLIHAFAARWLGVSVETARAQRFDRVGKYGTTLEWLMAEHGLTDVDEYYAFVHPDGEEENLVPDPALRRYLESLPVPASILTNSPMEHAVRVLRKLELEGIFENIYDIRWNELKGKPAPRAFSRVLDVVGHKPEETLFVDDLPAYLEGYASIGGFAVLIDDQDVNQDSKYPRVRSIPELSRFFS